MMRFASSIFLAIALSFLATVGAETFSVRCQHLATEGQGRLACSLSRGAVHEADVIGSFYDEINTTGWSRLYVRSHAVTNRTGFAAGYLEGALTADRIVQHLYNLKTTGNLFNLTPKVQAFVESTDAWIRAQLAAVDAADPYWSTVRLIYDQMDGMLVGANDHLDTTQQLTRLDVLLLGLMGDMDDIKMSADVTKRMNFENMSTYEVSLWAQAHGHCSALVKLTPDGKELFVGHNMWWSYSEMLRVFKRYEFGSLPAIAMSSFPGVLASADDFYQMDRLVVMETTITVYNHDLLAHASSSALPYWIRAMTANYMAKSGPDWMNIFKKHNSGTYNNMWMVVDYSKFTPGSPLPSGLFTVGEQLPGYFHFEDQTHVLSYGYWPSYNVAVYPETSTLSGQEHIELKHPQLSYQQSARAQIFRRDQGNVQSDEDMQRIMRYNKYQTDEFAHGNTCNQLACRSDLPNIVEGADGVGGGGASHASASALTQAFGAIDAKYTSFAHVKARQTIAISGPTHDDQPVFDWTQADPAVRQTAHLGQPDRFDFDWVVMTSDMNVETPEWWTKPNEVHSRMAIATSAVIAVLVAALFVVFVALKSRGTFRKRYDSDDCYHNLSNANKVRPVPSPGNVSTTAGSLCSPGSDIAWVQHSP